MKRLLPFIFIVNCASISLALDVVDLSKAVSANLQKRSAFAFDVQIVLINYGSVKSSSASDIYNLANTSPMGPYFLREVILERSGKVRIADSTVDSFGKLSETIKYNETEESPNDLNFDTALRKGIFSISPGFFSHAGLVQYLAFFNASFQKSLSVFGIDNMEITSVESGKQFLVKVNALEADRYFIVDAISCLIKATVEVPVTVEDYGKRQIETYRAILKQQKISDPEIKMALKDYHENTLQKDLLKQYATVRRTIIVSRYIYKN